MVRHLISLPADRQHRLYIRGILLQSLGRDKAAENLHPGESRVLAKPGPFAEELPPLPALLPREKQRRRLPHCSILPAGDGFHPAAPFPCTPRSRGGIVSQTGTPKAILPRAHFQLFYKAALAFSTRAVKPAASAMAISESIFRFKVTPAFFRPFIKVE